MQLKKYHAGTHRSCSPEETLEKISPFLKDMGITRVANLTGLDHIGIPVIGVTRPNSKSLATAQGKGHSLIAAKVSGVMESIEGYHAENIDLKTTRSSYSDLDQSLDLNLLSRSSEKDFDHDIEIDWLRCSHVNKKTSAWLPYDLIHTDFSLPISQDNGYFISDSNGLASGNTLDEAINHGLYEVIERDCLALWQLTPPELHNEKRIKLNTIKEPFLLSILEILKQKNIHIGVWDITTDTDIPTFICKIVSDKNTGIRPAYGSGTHLNKNVALSRAITEAAQSRVTFIAGARDDQYHDLYESEISDDVYNVWLNELRDTESKSSNSFEDIPLVNFESLEKDQEYVLEKLSDIGINDAYFADLTKRKYNIPVVKVVIAGLESVTHVEKRLLGQRGIQFYDQYGVGACEVK